jgi:hypothetical protein
MNETLLTNKALLTGVQRMARNRTSHPAPLPMNLWQVLLGPGLRISGTAITLIGARQAQGAP